MLPVSNQNSSLVKLYSKKLAIPSKHEYFRGTNEGKN